MNINLTGVSGASSSNEDVIISKKSNKGKANKHSNDSQKSKISSIRKDTLANQSHEKSIDLGKRSKVEVKVKKDVAKRSKENGHRLDNKARREEKFRIENPPTISVEGSDDVYQLKLLELEKNTLSKIPDRTDKNVSRLVKSIIDQDIQRAITIISTINQPISRENQKFLIAQVNRFDCLELQKPLLEQYDLFPSKDSSSSRRRGAEQDATVKHTPLKKQVK